ncbi:MAG: efflux RND transporter permease subunit [Deltaproteobacteria bacterium]|nr:efflux RND transporter permease subunit [Deltaproteobacteria bacterium]
MTGSELFKGPIAWMAQNPVVANLVMLMVVVGGLFSAAGIKTEIFPEFDLDIITVQVPYPGASPVDVEQGIVLAVEEEVRSLEGIKRVSSTSAEGAGMISLELLISADPDQVLSDVKSAVDRITSFPEEAERPVVSLATRRSRVISVVLSGELDLRTLHVLAERARTKMLEDPQISQVELEGIPPVEVSIEVPRQQLEALGMTLDEVARVVQLASLELPGGAVDTRGGQILLRVADRRLTGAEFADIPVRSTSDGRIVRLGDVAQIEDGYADTDQASFLDGVPAVRVTAYRVGDETPMKVSTAAKRIAEDLEDELPDTVRVSLWDDDSVKLVDRISLLTSNAAMGLVLVVGLLALFLRFNLALWVALGIPISFLGAFVLMPTMDLSINMLSLFALIVTLGMVVDDAIVVGENAYSKMEQGMDPLRAAVLGAREMAVPVTFSILTTVAAFAPLLFVPGFSGKLFSIIPMIVVSVLLVSLFESFFILPAHLAHSRTGPPTTRLARIMDIPRAWTSGKLAWFTDDVYGPAMQRMVAHKHVVMAVATGVLFVSFGLLGGQWVPFEYFPSLEGNQVVASARLPYGSPVEHTEQVARALEASSRQALKDLGQEHAFVALYTKVGEAAAAGGHSAGAPEVGSHLVSLEMELVPTDFRDATAEEIGAAWAAATPQIPGLEALTFSSTLGPSAGAAADVILAHTDRAILAQAADAMEEELRGYAELTNVENGWNAGKTQLDYSLTPAGQTLGMSSSDVARQLRAAFFGAEALREQRGRDEVKVMVRLPEAQRRSENDLENLHLRTPGGGYAPLSHLVRWERGRSPTSILREDGWRIVHVSGTLAVGAASSQPVLKDLRERVFPDFQERFPGLRIEMAGQQRSQAESMASLKTNYLFALFAIYALIAIPFKSYIKPLVVMSAIPFGIAGAIFGHLLMGFPLSIISIFGIVALSGVVVNDSLVLIDAANRFLEEGMSQQDAILRAGARRLRPILLTSLTTFLGLAPLILETSPQARLLIPMAISLGFGILAATVVVLVVVPNLYLVIEDLRRAVGSAWRWVLAP